MKLERARLGVNIDHVATIRNARGGVHPDPAKAAAIAQAAGADGITIHLREDRRHIRDADLEAVRTAVNLPINLEMATTDEMLAIALAYKPHAACLVPERREERTTEGGTLTAELRAVNHRFLELGVRLPDELRVLEPALRERVAARVSRGKLDLTLRLRAPEGAGALQLNPRVVAQLYRALGGGWQPEATTAAPTP